MVTSHDSGLSLDVRRLIVLIVLFLAVVLPQAAFAQSMTLTGSVSPKPVSYIGTLTWSASASGGDPATTKFAFFRRRPGGTWIPSVSAPNWQSGSTYNWNPTLSDVGTWETYIWVKDGTTPPTANTYGYAAGYNTMPVDVIGPPTAPGPTTVSCDYTGGGQCWVTGDFVASVSASTGGLGSLSYQICRSNDTTGWGGCDVNLTLNGGTSITVSGSHLPSDGYQRAYYFQSRDSAGAYSGWNTPKFVRVDRYAPSVSASNASSLWFSNRTATLSASDSGSGVQSIRYSWNSPHNAGCTTGTATSSGATLTAPAGDNLLYLCAKDNTGRVGQWSGSYRVSPLGLTGSVSPASGSYLGSFTYTASASGGTPSTTRYAFFRRRPGGTWIPDVNNPPWQSGNVYSWTPTSSDTGTWETYIWVKDGDTPAGMNGYGYAAGFNTGPITVLGPPTVPGPTTTSCAYTASGECWVQSDFTASVTASTGGSGNLVYQICRSNDTTGFGGCDVNLTLTGGTSILVSGTHLPTDGYRRAYYFQAKDSAGAYSGWNTPLYVRVDRYAPSVSATNASDVDWYSSRTATVSASDAHSGVQSVRYSWNAALDAGCTTGTATSSGATLTAPVGDNTLYLCAKDNTGRVGQWSGRYRVSAPLSLACSISPASGSYAGGFTYTATASGGIPSTIQYAFFHRLPGGTWVPAVTAPQWQAGNQYKWMPSSSEAGTWETYVWVKDRDTPANMNTYGYAAGCNSGPITVIGPPTVPGPTTVSCPYTAAGECWVQGDFTASVTASTGGTGSLVYQICRSNDTTGFGGCDVNLTLTGGTSILVSGTHLPSDGYRRAFYFQAMDSGGGLSGWNTPLYVRVDRYEPTVSATNASDTVWYSSRSAMVAANDSGSGLQSIRYSWGTALDAGCTTGTATSAGTALSAPAGDNLLYLCAKDNTGRVGQWSGRYRVSPLTLTGTVSPKPASYLGTVTYTAAATGGTPASTQYAFFRRTGGGAWIPDVATPNWQPGSTFNWNPTQSDVGTWETYIWVKDADTPAAMNTYGYAAGFNTGPIDIVGKPTVPGPTTVSCAWTTAEDCWVQGDFTASVTASSGGMGSLVYQICRSNDTTGFGGCDVSLTLTGGTSILVSGSDLPADGFRRSYWFQAKDSAGALSGWNTPRSVRVDRNAPTVGASDASDAWFRTRTAVVSASDPGTGGSGLAAVRYNWSTALDAGCTNGTVTSSGATLTAPAGDNTLYLCARDNTGRVAQWSGRYKVAASPTITVTPSPAKSSYLDPITWTATPSGGVPGTIEYTFARHRAGSSDPWISSAWQPGNVFTWQPTLDDAGVWDTFVVVRDSLTLPDENGTGYAAGTNPGQVEIVGRPTVPGPTTLTCNYSSPSGECWVWGEEDVTASVTPSTGGLGSLVYQICRSSDTTGFGGCEVNLTLNGGASIVILATDLPADGFRRAYWFQARDSAGALSGWNTPAYLRVDRLPPWSSATNASEEWFTSRTATVSAADDDASLSSGLRELRYAWNTDACSDGTVVAPGTTLTVPAGDNLLSLCAWDNVGWNGVWSGRYRVTPDLLVTGTVSPRKTSHGNTFTFTATASGGAPGTYQYAFFRRRPGGTWIPDVNAPSWQTGDSFAWTPAQDDVGVWETYVWARDANTSPTQNNYGYGAGHNTQPIEVLPALTLTGTRSPATSRAGDTLSWTAFADGGDPDTREFAFFRRRPNGTWIPDVHAPDWQPSNVLTWTPTAADLGVWEIYIWVKDATTPPGQNTYGYGAGFNPGPVEILEPEPPDFAIELTPVANTIVRGAGVQHTISITGNVTFTGTVALSVSGLPPASSHTLQPAEIGEGDEAELLVTTTADTLPGTYDVTITGEGSGLTRTAVASLTVRLPAATGAPVIDSISPESFDGGGVKTLTLRGRNFQDATVTVTQEDPDPDDPTDRVFPTVGQVTISPDGTRIDVQVDCTAPGIMDYYALVVDNGVGKEVSLPFRVIPQGPVVDLVTPSKPERGEDNVYVLTLGGYHLGNATVHTEPAGALVIFGLDATESHINGLLRVPDDAPLGPVDLVVTGSTGLEFRVTIEIVAPGAALIATQRLGTRRVDPVTLRAMAGPSPTVLFQRFAVRDPRATEVTDKGMKVRTATSMEKLSADSFTFTLHYRYTLNLLNFSWSRAFVFDPLTQRIGDEILKNLGLGDKVRLGAFVLSFALRVDLTIDVYITNTGFTWPRFCILITTAIQIPGTDGFYEQWSFCGGGRWFSFRGGSTDSLSATGGPCAEVTPEGPPVDGMLYAEVEQTACCSQPVEVSGRGYSLVTGPFDLTTENAGSTTPGPSCTCSLMTPKVCVLKDGAQSYTAVAPGQGTYQWRISRGTSHARILGDATRSTVVVEGASTSQAANDVELEMVYTEGANTCTQRVNLSVVDIELVNGSKLVFQSSGLADAEYAVRNIPQLGMPQLGPNRPHPPSATFFNKNMNVKARVSPCDPNLRCDFDFKRTRQGSVAQLNPDGTTRLGGGHCPAGGCDDDAGDSEEDLAVDPSPACTIYGFDGPGFDTRSTNGACPGFNGGRVITCMNFNDWLTVDDEVATPILSWHAATRVRCDQSLFDYESSGAGNSLGLGHIDCSPQTALATSSTAPSLVLAAQTPMESVSRLDDASVAVRSAEYRSLLSKVGRGEIRGEERAEIVAALLEHARAEAKVGEIDSVPLLAIQLLGELRAAEAIPVLLDRLLDDFARFVITDADRATPAAQALAKIGAPAMEPLLDLAATADDEWRMAQASLELMHQPGRLREAVKARLAQDTGAREEERLRALLDIADRQGARGR